MKSDKLEQTIKHYLINNLLKIEKLKNKDNEYLNPELRLWKDKKITLSSSVFNTLPYSKHEELKQKDALFYIEANQTNQVNKELSVEKDIQIFQLDKSKKGIVKKSICDIECKMVHYLDHAQGKVSTKLFEKIMNAKFKQMKLDKIDFSTQLAFFINPLTQQTCNYYVFCFSDTLSSPKMKSMNPNRELDPTKTSYINNEEFNKYKIVCPEITFDDLNKLYQQHKMDNNYFNRDERIKIKKILRAGKEYFEKNFKLEFPFATNGNKVLCLFPQDKTHKVANGHYRNPDTEKFEGGKYVSNYPFVSDVYKHYLKPIVLEYAKENYDRLIKEAHELTNLKQNRINKQEEQLKEIIEKQKQL